MTTLASYAHLRNRLYLALALNAAIMNEIEGNPFDPMATALALVIIGLLLLILTVRHNGRQGDGKGA